MTTEVIVRANHGWPVRVTKIAESNVSDVRIVPSNTEERFCVYDGCDLLIHEIQPNELDTIVTPDNADKVSVS